MISVLISNIQILDSNPTPQHKEKTTMIYIVLTITPEFYIYWKAFTNKKDAERYFKNEQKISEEQVRDIGYYNSVEIKVVQWNNTKKAFIENFNSVA